MRDATGEVKGQRFLRPARGEARARAHRLDVPAAARGVALAVLAVLSLALGRAWLLSTPRLAVRVVVFDGGERTSGPALDAVRRSLVGRNLLSLDLSSVERRVLSASPWAREVTVHRSLPGRVDVALVEHVPVARLASGDALVARDGRLLPSSPVLPGDASLPVLAVAPGRVPAAEALGRGVELVALLGLGRDPLARRLASIDVTEADDLVLRLVDLPFAVRLGPGDLVAQLNRLRNVEPVLRGRFASIETVDLRFRDRVVVSPVPVDSKTPKAGAASGG